MAVTVDATKGAYIIPALAGSGYVPLGGGTMTGALTLPNGTAAAPSLNFASALTSGLYAIASNTLAFSSNGTRHMYMSGSAIWVDVQLGFLNTSGNVRFGSASASDPILYRFADGALYLRPSATSVPCAFQISTLYTDASNYERLTLTGVAGTSVNITAETLGTGGDNLNIVLTPAGSGFTDTAALIRAQGFYNRYSSTDVGFWTNDTFQLQALAKISWSSTTNANGAVDTALRRSSAGVLDLDSGTSTQYRDLKLRNLIQTEYQQMTEMTAPAAPATNSVRIYAEDNGAGKTRLMALFATGSAVQLGIEP